MSQVRILPRALRFIHQHLRGTAEDRHALLIRGGECDIGKGPAVVARRTAVISTRAVRVSPGQTCETIRPPNDRTLA
ncbi:hypothetical protein GS482_10675 [Rhodococcus hoagii]|nr:hypothetical protein [Prescottella equi]